jgi:N-acetylglucosamine-6-sulfatase
MRSPRLSSLLLAAVALLALAAVSAAQTEPAAEDPPPPNVILLMTDDQSIGDLRVMPRTRRLIAAKGVTFTRSFVSYPLCCPSRATALTGQYAHTHDVRCLYRRCGGGYGKLDQSEYLPTWLERAGYVTAHIGKFLNGYGSEWTADLPAGWTEWYGLVDDSTYRMWGYKMQENGRTRTYGRKLVEKPRFYQTDVLARKSRRFIRRRAPDEDPFFLSVAFVAPHHEKGPLQGLTGHFVRPAPRHKGRFAEARLRRARSYDERDVSDKPAFHRRWRRPLTPRGHVAIVTRMRERWESLLAVDEAVASIVAQLRASGELDDTYIIFTSDNGFMQGEHRVPIGKMLPYDPSTRVPLLIRGPGVARGRRSRELVANIDLAPTILDATPATSPEPLDGRSFLPFLRNVGLRSLRPLLHETAGKGAFGLRRREEGAKRVQPRVPAWRAVRTMRWLFVDYKGPARELYDLRRDPAQLRSLHADPRYRVRLRTLRRILGDLTDCEGRECDTRAAASVR